ncbi:class I SAM-dependent methyltransferase [Scytonema millei]|uniref:Class I SAM-dependent methyltransferase n=1 Tax=Scytonema millei VB511283 TaxID=1245923 RepID=A0A9X5I4U7_9CYAN|nr:class I SAM-dependent methyltransferase [Scytonema millei]NHC34847.1 class I SAM-dependent methyltransferase [Scytonema millei VB511283]
MREAQPRDRKQQVTFGFNLAAPGYDSPALRFLPACANRVVEIANLQPGQRVLDIATGTGTAAIASARKVGSKGQVVGIDLSQNMLEQARQKIANTDLNNINLRQEDAEKFSFGDNSFDTAICASGIFFLSDMLAGLREWWRVIKPGGTVVLSSFSKMAFEPMAETISAQIQAYEVPSPSSREQIDTPEKCFNIMQAASFEKIELQIEQLGYFLSSLDEWWELVWNAGFRIRLSQIPTEKIEQFKVEHLAAIAKFMTDKGIWLDVETIFVKGKKPNL